MGSIFIPAAQFDSDSHRGEGCFLIKHLYPGKWILDFCISIRGKRGRMRPLLHKESLESLLTGNSEHLFSMSFLHKESLEKEAFNCL